MKKIILLMFLLPKLTLAGVFSVEGSIVIKEVAVGLQALPIVVVETESRYYIIDPKTAYQTKVCDKGIVELEQSTNFESNGYESYKVISSPCM